MTYLPFDTSAASSSEATDIDLSTLSAQIDGLESAAAAISVDLGNLDNQMQALLSSPPVDVSRGITVGDAFAQPGNVGLSAVTAEEQELLAKPPMVSFLAAPPAGNTGAGLGTDDSATNRTQASDTSTWDIRNFDINEHINEHSFVIFLFLGIVVCIPILLYCASYMSLE